ncbi:MAG: ATP-binding protein [Phycisphaerae bacterium]
MTAPASQSGPPHGVELTITSDSQSLPVVRSAVMRMAELEGFPSEAVQHVALAVDEALANVIRHGYGGANDRPIHINLERVAGASGRIGLAVTVRDFGRQIDPAAIQGRDLDDVRPGGLGVHIMRTCMDEVEFSCPAEGGMLLRMVKYADPAPAARPDRRKESPS